jgi:hypothetical protein
MGKKIAQPPPDMKRVLELAFPDESPPARLSAAVVSVVELCHLGMPDARKLRELIRGADFQEGAPSKAEEAGQMLALDVKLVETPIRDLRHELFGRGRRGEPVLLLLSQGKTGKGDIVFLSALFKGAIEADAVKAASHVSKTKPITGSKIRNHNGNEVRRVFWDVKGAAGIRGFVVSGPQDVESTALTRAFTAIAWGK